MWSIYSDIGGNLPKARSRHCLLHCMDFAQQRESMISRIEIAYHHYNVPPGQRTLDVKTLLGGSSHREEVRSAIQRAVLGFLVDPKETI